MQATYSATKFALHVRKILILSLLYILHTVF